MGANEFKKKKGFSLDFLSSYGFQHQACFVQHIHFLVLHMALYRGGWENLKNSWSNL